MSSCARRMCSSSSQIECTPSAGRTWRSFGLTPASAASGATCAEPLRNNSTTFFLSALSSMMVSSINARGALFDLAVIFTQLLRRQQPDEFALPVFDVAPAINLEFNAGQGRCRHAPALAGQPRQQVFKAGIVADHQHTPVLIRQPSHNVQQPCGRGVVDTL